MTRGFRARLSQLWKQAQPALSSAPITKVAVRDSPAVDAVMSPTPTRGGLLCSFLPYYFAHFCSQATKVAPHIFHPGRKGE